MQLYNLSTIYMMHAEQFSSTRKECESEMFAIDKTVDVAEHSWVCNLRCVEATAEFLLLARLGGGNRQTVCSKSVQKQYNS